MPDDRTDARHLSQLLDGAGDGDGELEVVANLLRRAADAARFDVPAAEVERALARARPQAGARPRRRRGAAILVTATAVAAASLLLLPLGGGPGTVQVQARALDALGSAASVLRVVEVVRPGPGGAFPASVRRGWIDVSGDRQRWTQTTLAGAVVSETLVDRGRVTRYEPATGAAVVATSCRALASGCAEATDPVAFYRRALAGARAVAAAPVTDRGRDALRFSLPIERLPGAAPVTQEVTVDAGTFLPLRIRWLQADRVVATILVRSITSTASGLEPRGAFDLSLPPGTRIRQVDASGTAVRAVSTRTLTVAQARALRPVPWWPGRRALGHRLSAIALVRYTGGGSAVRFRYGPTVVWDYERTVPPQLLARRTPLKQVPVGNAVGRIYATGHGVLVGEVDTPWGTAAIVAPALDPGSVFTALAALRPL